MVSFSSTTFRLTLVLIVSVCFFIAEITIGFKTKSLAIIADAFHYANDIIAYAIAVGAAYLHDRGKPNANLTYAFNRASLLGAFFNGSLLLALGLSIFLQSIERFINVQDVDQPLLVVIIGIVGLILNVLSAAILGGDHGHSHGGHGHNHGNKPSTGSEDALEMSVPRPIDVGLHSSHHHNQLSPPARSINFGVLGVLVHLAGDALNNIGVIVAGLIIWRLSSPSRFYADPAVSLLISLFIFASALPLVRRTGWILLEAAPIHLDLDHVRADLTSVPGVVSLHDLHVWHLSQTVILATLHVRVVALNDTWPGVEAELRSCLRAYGVQHSTIAPEVDSTCAETEGGLVECAVTANASG